MTNSFGPYFAEQVQPYRTYTRTEIISFTLPYFTFSFKTPVWFPHKIFPHIHQETKAHTFNPLTETQHTQSKTNCKQQIKQPSVMDETEA